jgi:DNA-binding transcriptional regulator YdaS (Cro superfamily)
MEDDMLQPRIRLKMWLAEKEIRQGTFAQMIGVSFHVVSNILTGRTKPTPDVAQAIERETRGAIKAVEWTQ